MLLSDDRRVVSALSVMAGVFVAGVAAGFAVPQAAGLWPWPLAFAIWLALVAYGFSLPVPRAVFVFVAGVVLAMHTESALVCVKGHAARHSPDGGAPVWRLVVEGNAYTRASKDGETMLAHFMSHAGPQPVKVVLPVVPGAPAPRLGEVWECAGWLKFPKEPRDRYRPRTLWVNDGSSARCVASAGWRVWRRLSHDFSGEIARRMELGIRWCPEVAALNRAMLLGRRADVSPARRESFVVSGTVHVFAISGLHVMLIAHLLERLLGAIGLPVRLRSALVIAPVVAYVLMTGMRPSAVRAALMAGFYYSAAVFGRRPDSLAAWSLAVFTVYGLNPERLFDAGCALSFTVMLGIVVLIKWMSEFSVPRIVRLFLVSRAGKAIRRRLGWLFDGWHVSFAAWAAGTPVAARIFGRFTWGGLVANVLAVRLASLTVVFGFMGVVASFVSFRVAALCNLVAASFTYALLLLADLMARLPDVSFSVRPWTLLECAAWYGVFILLLLVLERVLPRRHDLSGKWWQSGLLHF
jgi:ComEC/Rec2-related protein